MFGTTCYRVRGLVQSKVTESLAGEHSHNGQDLMTAIELRAAYEHLCRLPKTSHRQDEYEGGYAGDKPVDPMGTLP